MENFSDKGTNFSYGKTWESFAISKNGFLIPVKIARKMYCNLIFGMMHIAAIEMHENAHEKDSIIITDEKGLIGGLTKNLARKIMLSPTVISSKKLNINALCTDVDE